MQKVAAYSYPLIGKCDKGSKQPNENGELIDGALQSHSLLKAEHSVVLYSSGCIILLLFDEEGDRYQDRLD